MIETKWAGLLSLGIFLRGQFIATVIMNRGKCLLSCPMQSVGLARLKPMATRALPACCSLQIGGRQWHKTVAAQKLCSFCSWSPESHFLPRST